MATRKKQSGHYCRVCGRNRANEKFSGKGHARHICKDCERDQKHLAKLKRKGTVIEPAVLLSPPPDDLIYHLDESDDEVFDPDESYWTEIRPFED